MNTFTINTVVVGHKESFAVQITDEMQSMFTKISGDVNPMHLDVDFAQKGGFADKLVYGMLTASFFSTLVGVYLPGKHCLFQECSVQFVKPVYIGDILTISGEVKDVNTVFNRITIKADVVNQNGVKVSRAKLAVGIQESE